MTTSPSNPRIPAAQNQQFATTRWSVVMAAGRDHSAQSREALAALCASYWYPLYAYVRRKGYDAAAAEDLIQGFFARLLEKEDLVAVDPSRGRFRSWLLAALNHYLLNQWKRARTQKRGGERPLVSIDLRDADGRYCAEPAHEGTAERLYQRQWALALLQRVQDALREESCAAGAAERFDRLCRYLGGERGAPAYCEAATALGITEGAVRTAVHRLRRRFGELLREEIAQTVSGEGAEVEREIQDLFEALRG